MTNTVKNGICEQCGRDYSDWEPEFHNGDCPAMDDCPAYFECEGIEHPAHPDNFMSYKILDSSLLSQPSKAQSSDPMNRRKTMATKWINNNLDLSNSSLRMANESGAMAFFYKKEAIPVAKQYGFSAQHCVQAETRLDKFWVIRDPASELILCNDGQMRPVN